LIYSIAPILYNIGIILGIIFLTPIWGIYGVAFGVLIGAFFHFFVQFLASRSYGYKYKLVLDFKFKGLKEFFTLIFPRAIAAAASQFNFIIITAIASTITVGAISVFNFANNLRFLPVGFIGVSFATALFPHLSKSATDNNKEEFRNSFKKVFKTVLYISFPVGVLTFIMRDLIVKTVLEAGAFTGYAVEITGACLGVFALSLFLQCLEPILLRGFFSIKDTKTPTIIALVFLAINTIFSFGFVYLLQTSKCLSITVVKLFNLGSLDEALLLGLTFAFSLSLIIEYLLLYVFLKKKIGDFGSKEIWKSFIFIVLSSAIMSIVAIFLLNHINLGTGFFMYLLTFIIITSISFLVYFILTTTFKLEEGRTILKKLTF
jgi:putative peptidoglycan lipid II flippase